MVLWLLVRSSLSTSSTFAADWAMPQGWPGVEPVIAELLGWVQDANWPVAHALTPLLRSIGEPLAPYLVPILDGDDHVWKCWVILLLLTDAAPGLVGRFGPLLERIADHPTDEGRAEELDQVAAVALGRTVERGCIPADVRHCCMVGGRPWAAVGDSSSGRMPSSRREDAWRRARVIASDQGCRCRR